VVAVPPLLLKVTVTPLIQVPFEVLARPEIDGAARTLLISTAMSTKRIIAKTTNSFFFILGSLLFGKFQKHLSNGRNKG
jgi:hypothetical protein